MYRWALAIRCSVQFRKQVLKRPIAKTLCGTLNPNSEQLRASMLIKSADDRSHDLDRLKGLLARPDVPAGTRKQIEREIRNIAAGTRGESEAAFEIDFHYGDSSKNWMVLHDLRLEHEGRVAQIDHLVMNRLLEFFVCESKHFAEGVAINEQGEFSAFWDGKPHGIPSPLEQNQRHIAVLSAVLNSGEVSLPRRLGISLTPSLKSLVLVSKRARISRPKTLVRGIETVMKSDQLHAYLQGHFDEGLGVLALAKAINADTLENIARQLAAMHRPTRIDWAARFGLHPDAMPRTRPPQPVTSPTIPTTVPDEIETTAEPKAKGKLVCANCDASVSYAVAKFCWTNKRKFGGSVYCMDCQKTVVQPANV